MSITSSPYSVKNQSLSWLHVYRLSFFFLAWNQPKWKQTLGCHRQWRVMDFLLNLLWRALLCRCAHRDLDGLMDFFSAKFTELFEIRKVPKTIMYSSVYCVQRRLFKWSDIKYILQSAFLVICFHFSFRTPVVSITRVWTPLHVNPPSTKLVNSLDVCLPFLSILIICSFIWCLFCKNSGIDSFACKLLQIWFRGLISCIGAGDIRVQIALAGTSWCTFCRMAAYVTGVVILRNRVL